MKLIKEIINDLEDKFPVNKWKVDGIHVWPYIRIKIYIFLLQANKNDIEKKQNETYVKLFFQKQLFNFFLIPFRLIFAFFEITQFFLKLKRKKILFFGSYFHKVKIKDEYFNRFFDSMVDFHGIKDEVYLIEFQKIYKKNYNQKAIIPLTKYLNHYKLIKKIIINFKSDNTNVFLEKYTDFLVELNNLNINSVSLKLSKNDIINWGGKIKNTKGFYSILYALVKPEKIIMLSYYGFDDLAAAMVVANDLNIKTIDFQHGPQTNVHMAYSSWSNYPKTGFNTMPIEYWNWDENSKRNIDLWAAHKTIVNSKIVGHPFLSYWKNNMVNEIVQNKRILYSLQLSTFEDLFTNKLIQTINNSKYGWTFRIHPRSGFNFYNLKMFLNDKITIDNYIIEDAINIPLPSSLSNSIIHVDRKSVV